MLQRATSIENNVNCIKSYNQRVSHEHGFHILKCIWVGLWARRVSRPSHTTPTPPSHNLSQFVCLLGLIFHRFVGRISENCSSFRARISVHPRNNSKKVSCKAIRLTFLATAELPANSVQRCMF